MSPNIGLPARTASAACNLLELLLLLLLPSANTAYELRQR